jgi:hypothetical protein
LLLLAASTASCGLFVLSLDGYEGHADAGVDAANPTDAADMPETSIPGDAVGEPFDGGVVDSASPAKDGSGTDAMQLDATTTDVFDSGDSPACPPGHPTAIFCDDFDHGPLGATWNASPAPRQTTLSLSDAEASSPPSSMHVEVWADASPPRASGFLASTIDAVPSKLRASFDLWVDAMPSRSSQVSIVGLTDGTNTDTFYLRMNGSGTSVEILYVGEDESRDGGEQQLALSASVPLGAWVRAILDLDLGAKTMNLTLETPPGTLGVPVAEGVPITLDLTPVSVVALAGLDALVFGAGQPSTCSFYVDNVVVESE